MNDIKIFKLISSSTLKIKSRNTKFPRLIRRTIIFSMHSVIFISYLKPKTFFKTSLNSHVYWYTLYQNSHVYWYTLYQNSHVYWYTLYQLPMFIGTPCTSYTRLLVHPVPTTHVYWDKLYLLPMFIGTNCTSYPYYLGQTVPADCSYP